MKDQKIKYFRSNPIYLVLIFYFISCDSQNDYSGSWESRGDVFENILVLEKIKKNSYKFSFKGWRKSYDHFSRDTVKFFGNMNNDEFKVTIKDGYAEYIDSKDMTTDDLKLYNEKEEPCKILFEFRENIIKVKTEDCHLIYGGFGVLFDGKYSNKK